MALEDKTEKTDENGFREFVLLGPPLTIIEPEKPEDNLSSNSKEGNKIKEIAKYLNLEIIDLYHQVYA